MGGGEVLHDVGEGEDDVLDMHSIICLIFEILHMNSGHIAQGLYDQHLELYLLAIMVYELIHSNPFAILQPFLKFREIGVFRIFRWDDDANILIILVIAEFLSDVVEAEYFVEEVHYCIYILIWCFYFEGFEDSVGNKFILGEDWFLHEEIGDHQHAVEMDAYEMALELAMRFSEGLLEWLWVIVFEGGDDLTEEL